MFRVAKYYRVPNYTNYSSVIVSAEAIKHLTKGSDVSIKPVRNVTPQEGDQHQLKGHPTQQTNPEARYTAK